ncbi:MAG: shikimate kinase [Alphaproteobacteria bacterium]
MDDTSLGIKQPIVLLGMMGCGKSHIGRVLTGRLEHPYIDSDSLLEEEQECSIAEIFDVKGEAFFRKLEADLIARLMKRGACVISTGGGAITTPETLDRILRGGISIWIKTDPQKIFERIKDDTKRPLLQCADPRQRIQDLYDSRKALYAQADIHVDNSADTPNVTVDEIMQALQKFL